MEDFYATYGRNLNLDKYVKLAARVCNRPSAILHLLGDKDQHTLAEYGTENNVGFCMNRRDSICDFTGKLSSGEVLSIKDTLVDDRVKNLPAVAGPPHYRWYLGTPIYSSNNLVGALCVLDKSDDVAEATDAMKESLIDLADCVATELDLRADCSMALRAKRDFLTSVSHELRDPMHGISMGIELLGASRSGSTDDMLAIETVRKCSSSLEGLVDKILCINDKDLAAGAITSTMDVFNVSEVVESVLDSAWLEDTLANGEILSQVTSILDIDADLIDRDFIFDRRHLSKIVLQLFQNAMKFTKTGSIVVKLGLTPCSAASCELRDTAHDNLHIQIQDTGSGMSPTFLNQAFDQFSQEDPLKGGVGLGLSVVRKLVHEVNGTIFMSSQVDKGSCVDVKFCINRAESSIDKRLVNVDVLAGTKYAVSGMLAADVRVSLEKYGSAMGLVLVDPSKADIVFTSQYSGDHIGTQPRIIILHDPQQRGQSLPGDVQISLPIGPCKLRDVLFNGVGLAATRMASPQAKNLESLQISQSVQSTPRSDTQAWSPPTLSAEESFGASQVNRHNRTCLIVDDNPINVKILSAFLKKRGYLYSCANDGIEAVQAVKARPSNSPFDVILMDINMPNMNGVEATRLIRNYQEKNNITESLIVAVSGCSDSEQQAAMARGLRHFFKKPVDLKKLVQFMDGGVLA